MFISLILMYVLAYGLFLGYLRLYWSEDNSIQEWLSDAFISLFWFFILSLWGIRKISPNFKNLFDKAKNKITMVIFRG